MESALRTPEVTTREYRIERDGELQVWDARYLPLAAGRGEPPDQLLLVATDVTEQRAAQEARLEAAIAQRDMLVKEVHHRIKNNLQGVAGLLQQIAKRKPEVAGAIDEVVGQVQAIAQVYGLQVGDTGPLSMVRVLEAITSSVRRTFGRTIHCRVDGPGVADWILPEGEAIPVALTLNELLTNAIKHSPRRRRRRRRRLRARGRGRRRAHRRPQPGAAAGGLQPRADSERRVRPRPGAGAAAAAQRHPAHRAGTSEHVVATVALRRRRS